MDCLKLMHLSLTVLVGLGISGSAQLKAESQTTATRPAIGECSREFLIAYFPPSLVEDALKKANVSQDKWDNITQALTASEKDVISQVEDKASKITPNPLRDPQQRQVALKIFRETLFQIFSEVLKKNGVTDDKQIQDMLDGIQQEKAKKFADCLEQHRRTSPQTSPTQAPQPAEAAPGPLAAATNPGLSTSPLTPSAPSTPAQAPSTPQNPIQVGNPHSKEYKHSIDNDQNILHHEHDSKYDGDHNDDERD